jgi:hypothetical protein
MKMAPSLPHGGFAPHKLGCSDFSRQKRRKNARNQPTQSLRESK